MTVLQMPEIPPPPPPPDVARTLAPNLFGDVLRNTGPKVMKVAGAKYFSGRVLCADRAFAPCPCDRWLGHCQVVGL